MVSFASQFPRLLRSSVCYSLFAAITLGSPGLVFGEPNTAVERAIDYLAAEVPKWHRENRCYSCHNNGDAVRALATAASQGLFRERKPLDDTLDFLRSPDKWDTNGPDGPFKDEKLARIQFAAALADATTSRLVGNRGPLESAAKLLAELQQPDGSWPADAEGTLGSPVTYGQPLATSMAIRSLLATDAKRFARRIERGQQWFLKRESHSVLDAAATLLALSNADYQAGRLPRTQALKLIAAGESDGGGWGPFVNSPPEVFDTAIVLIALNELQANEPQDRARITRGRGFLLAHQQADGSWPATTRPPGVNSYAQQVSTTGWALQALLVTRPEIPK